MQILALIVSRRKLDCKLFERPRMQKASGLASRGFQRIPAITYSRADWHYHGPQALNGRVRNGNGCFHLGMVTGKLLRLPVAPWSVNGDATLFLGVASPLTDQRTAGKPVYQLVAIRVDSA